VPEWGGRSAEVGVPVGVVMVTEVPAPCAPGRVVQPGACLVWLHASHTPCPLSALVRPPVGWAVAWSVWRIGASHQGVRQIWSRRIRSRRSPDGKCRRVESMVRSCPLVGSVYSRRSHAAAAVTGPGGQYESAGELGWDGTVAVD
jgi:hypothetical protein